MKISSVLGSLLLPLFILAVSNVIAKDTTINEFSLNESSFDSYENLLARLPSASFTEKSEIVRQLKGQGEEVIPLLEALLNSHLYYERENNQIHYVDKTASLKKIKPVLGDDAWVEVSDLRAYKKIRTNNSLRSKIRNAIAELELGSLDDAVRLSSAKRMVGKVTDGNIDLLRNKVGIEKKPLVKSVMEEAIGLYLLNGATDSESKLLALSKLSGSINPKVVSSVANLLDDEDASVSEKAQHLVNEFENKKNRYQFIETIFFGFSLGSVLLLAAIGLAITFGVMGVINMAHGEMMMLGAYTTYVVQIMLPNFIDASLWVAIPLAFLVAGSLGIIIQRFVIRYLSGRPLETLLATFGISLVLQQLVRTLFSPLNRQVSSPSWMEGSLEINPLLSLTYNRIYILVFALLVFAVLLLILKRSSLGLNVRAVSQNRNMAKSMGIKTEWVDALTFGLGSGVAGIAGVALSQLTNVGPNLGQSYIIDSFMVVVFGGVGNLFGTLIAAFTLGITNKFLEPAVGSVVANIFILIFIILFIQKRPNGLFPQKGRAADD